MIHPIVYDQTVRILVAFVAQVTFVRPLGAVSAHVHVQGVFPGERLVANVAPFSFRHCSATGPRVTSEERRCAHELFLTPLALTRQDRAACRSVLTELG